MSYIWVIILILVCCSNAYFSKLNNNNVPYSSIYLFLGSLIGALLWIWVTKISKNLLFDSILYDIILVVVFTGCFIFLKCGTGFTMINWCGLVLAVFGLILMKIS